MREIHQKQTGNGDFSHKNPSSCLFPAQDLLEKCWAPMSLKLMTIYTLNGNTPECSLISLFEHETAGYSGVLEINLSINFPFVGCDICGYIYIASKTKNCSLSYVPSSM